MRTLLLDNTYLPVGVVSWQKAMILLVTGRAEALIEYQDVKIRSTKSTYNLPKILRLFSRHQGHKHVRFTRINVFWRDQFQCQYCAEEFAPKGLTFDHVTPVSKGGKTNWENVVTCCSACNVQKGNKSPEEANMKLLKRPKRPKWSPRICLRIRDNDPSEWFDWLPAMV